MQDLSTDTGPGPLPQLDVTQPVQASQVQAEELRVTLALELNLENEELKSVLIIACHWIPDSFPPSRPDRNTILWSWATGVWPPAQSRGCNPRGCGPSSGRGTPGGSEKQDFSDIEHFRSRSSYPQLDILRSGLDLLLDDYLKGGAVLPVAGGQHGLPQLVHHVVVRYGLLGNLSN